MTQYWWGDGACASGRACGEHKCKLALYSEHGRASCLGCQCMQASLAGQGGAALGCKHVHASTCLLVVQEGAAGAEAAADEGGVAREAVGAQVAYPPYADPALGPPMVEREEWPPSPLPVPTGGLQHLILQTHSLCSVLQLLPDAREC